MFNQNQHKIYLVRILKEVYDNQTIRSSLGFKGGTAAYLFYNLPRFSVDLDFDLLPHAKKGTDTMRNLFHAVFRRLDLEVKDESKTTLLFLLRYKANSEQRNTIELDAVEEGFTSNAYQPEYLSELDRYMNCHTVETMFGNKLVALIDRYEKHFAIAGRDLYDIHFFFTHEYTYIPEIITERRNVEPTIYLQELITFINTKVTQTIIDQDLNTLLPYKTFRKIRGVIKQETLVLLQDEVKRLSR